MTAELKNIVIIGATASGKSALATELARRLNGEILSVDSMQVYRGMSIGTAKPTVEEQRDIRHHLIDVVSPDEEFSVAHFVHHADAVIADAQTRGVPLIIAGGTPMYFKALFDGLFEGPSADADLRALLNAHSLDDLHKKLTSIDPQAAGRIHANDRRRLIRALEVFELTGRTISSLQSHWTDNSVRRHDARWFGLSWEKEELNRRINARVKQMTVQGWLDESRELMTRHGALSKTAGEATGYAALFAHLRGELSLENAIEQIKIDTRQLARRQMKWFRRFPNVTWLDGRRSSADLASELMSQV